MTSGTEEEKVYIHFLSTRKTRNKFGEENIFFVIVKKNGGEQGGKYLKIEIIFHLNKKIEEGKVRKYIFWRC